VLPEAQRLPPASINCQDWFALVEMNMQSRAGLVVIVEYSVLREQVCRVQ
jgi:hypothetical protein